MSSSQKQTGWLEECTVSALGTATESGSFCIGRETSSRRSWAAFVAAECREGAPETVESEIIRAVQRDVGLTVSEVVLLDAGSLPKTTSGKLQRSATRKQYLDGTLGLTHRRMESAAAS